MKTSSSLAVIICCLNWVNVATAQTTCQWKLSADDVLRYRIEKNADVALDGGDSAYRLVQVFDVTWHVQQVDTDGNTRVEQSIDNIRIELNDPLTDLRYDSADEADPSGVGAMAGAVLAKLREHPLAFTLSSRGQVSDLQAVESLLEAMGKGPLADTLKAIASADGLRNLLTSGLPVLPAQALVEGLSWPAATSRTTTSFGNVDVVADYQVQTVERNDKDNSVQIGVTRKLQVQPSADAALTIAQPESSGTIVFDCDAGRLRSSA